MKISEELERIITWDLIMMLKIKKDENILTTNSKDELVLIARQWLRDIKKFERENEKTN